MPAGLEHSRVGAGPSPRRLRLEKTVNFQTNVIFDMIPIFRDFGDVHTAAAQTCTPLPLSHAPCLLRAHSCTHARDRAGGLMRASCAHAPKARIAHRSRYGAGAWLRALAWTHRWLIDAHALNQRGGAINRHSFI